MKKQKVKNKKAKKARKVKSVRKASAKKKPAKTNSKKKSFKAVKKPIPKLLKELLPDAKFNSFSQDYVESYNPLAGSIAPLPDPPPEFYIEELLIWILDKPTSISCLHPFKGLISLNLIV